MSSEPQRPPPPAAGPLPLESIFERLPAGLALLGIDGHLTHANPAFERIVDQNRVDLIGQRLTDFVHRDDVADCGRAFQFVGHDRTERHVEVGRGSMFHIHLPPVQAAADAAAPVGGSETIMVVEDDPTVRALACAVLGAKGYDVLRADGPTEALRISAAHDGEIDLLLTDLVMPVMNGRDLAVRITAERPTTRVLFTTGYTEDNARRRDQLDGFQLLEKPFVPNALLHKVRELLDRTQTDRPETSRP
jgi:PAS domain S-box-containing protein